ncbi:Gfo/Idh/MocA family oxidoreductase [Cryomorphaceae bacterium]|nr:Gfo/Idh/MocA family oxidoreductase [Cryomorphaceae bacterium]
MKLKAGVLGAGHLGKIHIKLLIQSEEYELVGFYDADAENATAVSAEYGIPAFDTIEALIDAVDMVDIVTPTLSHYDCAVQALRKSKHLFIEKPITNTVAEAEELIRLAKEAGVKAQVGHVERFNPAFTTARPFINQPMFIETHRLAQFNPRGTDVPVVLDLMIHDLDIVLSIVKSSVKRVSASGVSVVSESPDIANARVEFDNGCVANLTSSRISMKNMRKTRIFQRDAYISVDFLTKETEIVRMKNVEGDLEDYAMVLDLENGNQKQIYFEKPDVPSNNAILDELNALAKAIQDNTETAVTLEDGHAALKLATDIVSKFNDELKPLSE